MLKYYFIRINERNGEQEYSIPIIRQLGKRKSIEKYMKDVIRTWYNSYSTKPEFADDGYYHLGGSIHVKIDHWCEISEKEFNILTRFI